MAEHSRKKGGHEGPADSVSAGRGRDYDKLRVNCDEQAVKWRFHRADQLWRWQKIDADQAVIAESPTAYASYAECLKAATSEGYRNPPSAAGLTEPT